MFIDADHHEVAVLADLRRFVPYCAAGGVVLCHDTKLANPAEHSGPLDVAKALDMFCAEYHLTARALPWEPDVIRHVKPLSWQERGGWYGLGVIEDPNGVIEGA